MAESRPSATVPSVTAPTSAISWSELPERFSDLVEEVHVLRLPMVTRFRGITER